MTKSKKKSRSLKFFSLFLLMLGIIISLSPPTLSNTKADSNPAVWVLCKFETGKVMYNATTTDLVPYSFRSKSAIISNDDIQINILNGLMSVAGFDFVKTNESILGRKINSTTIDPNTPKDPNVSAEGVNLFQRFGVAGLNWSSYGGEWKYYEIDACSESREASKTNFGKFYQSRKEPLSSYGEAAKSKDPRSIQFNRGLFSTWGSAINDTISNLLFFVAKFITTLAIVFTGLSFSDVTGIIGLTDPSGSAAGANIFTNLFNGVFLPLVTLSFTLNAVWMIYTGLIKRQIRHSLQSLMKAIFAFFIVIIMSVKASFWVGLPSKAATIGQALILEAMTGSYSATTGVCHIPDGDVIDKSDKDSAGFINTEKVGKRIQATIGCKLWEELLFRPWVQGQFGTSYENLEASKLNNVNKDWVGSAKVPIGQGKYIENWAAFQLSTQTNAHSALGENNVPKVISGVNNDWWRVVDALSNYEEGETVKKVPNSTESVKYTEQKETKPTDYWQNWTGNNSIERIGTSFIAILFAIVGSFLPFVLGLTSAVLGAGLVFIMMVSPIFFLFGTHPGKGQEMFNGWLEMLVNTFIKKVFIAVLLIFSFSVITASFEIVYKVGWIQGFIILTLLSIIIFKNRNKFLEQVANVSFGGRFNPMNGFRKVKDSVSNSGKRVGNVGVGAIVGANAARKSGQKILTGATTGAFTQIHNNLYRTPFGIDIARSYQHGLAKTKHGEFSNQNCINCGQIIIPGEISYLDIDGNMLCRLCGEESDRDDLVEIVTPKAQKHKENGTRTVNATDNESWLSHQKTKELTEMKIGEKGTVNWNNLNVQKMIQKNLNSLDKDIAKFKKAKTKLKGSARPPILPEPIQEYVDLALINQAWANGHYNYVKEVYALAWETWYLDNVSSVSNVTKEDVRTTREQLSFIIDEINKTNESTTHPTTNERKFNSSKAEPENKDPESGQSSKNENTKE